LKNLRRENLTEVEQRAFTFLTTNTTAPLPTVMQNRIIDLIGEEHPIVADVYTLNSSANISIPVTKSLDADAAKTAEGADHADLQVTMETIDLSGNDHTADVEMSYKMAAMAIDAFEDYLITLISGRLGALLATDIVANIKEGINAANKIQTGINYANVCGGFGALKRVGAVVIYGTRETIFNKIVGMVDGNKRPIFQQPITAEAAGHLLGAVIKYEDAVGAGELLIGDPKKYLQNVVVPVMIEPDRVVKKSKLVYAGYTCQEGTLTDDKAFALVAEDAG
jgi:HK97 family phage major capsid protein